MFSSTNVHAAGGTVEWEVEQAPTYLSLDIVATDELGGQHHVTVFCDWDQLADLCEQLTACESVSHVLLARARAAVRDQSTSAELSARANSVGARPMHSDSGASHVMRVLRGDSD